MFELKDYFHGLLFGSDLTIGNLLRITPKFNFLFQTFQNSNIDMISPL